jgi:hypothetical protein
LLCAAVKDFGGTFGDDSAEKEYQKLLQSYVEGSDPQVWGKLKKEAVINETDLQSYKVCQLPIRCLDGFRHPACMYLVKVYKTLSYQMSARIVTVMIE